jgi:Tol biopolymer transport system component
VDPRRVGSNSRPAWSPDGRYLAHLSPERNSLLGRDKVVFIRSVESGQTRELALKLMSLGQPEWSPDGRSFMAVGNDSEGRVGAFRIDAQTGAITLIPDTEHFRNRAVWALDGKSIFYSGADADTKGFVIRVRDLETMREKELYRAPSISNLALSTDGRQLAFTTWDPGTKSQALKILPTGAGEPRELLRLKKAEGITSIAWMPDGHHLLLGKDVKGPATELWRIRTAGGEPQRLGLAMERLQHLGVHPDGRRIAFTAGSPKQEVWVLENFLPAAQTARAAAPQQ